jgi:BMFP domain-containing protein YqiC
MFIPNWAVSTVFAAFLFLSGGTVAYFHAQAATNQRLALLEQRFEALEKGIEKAAINSKVRSTIAVEDLAKVQVTLEAIEAKLNEVQRQRKRGE